MSNFGEHDEACCYRRFADADDVCCPRAGHRKGAWEEAERRLAKSRKVDVLGANIFGDQVSNSNGALSFSVTDVSLPNVKETHLNAASNGQQYPSKPELRPARPEEIPGGLMRW